MAKQLVTKDGSRTLRHPTHQETYHSAFGALTESEMVFLRNSGVSARLERGIHTRVLEIGFGTGLNFLATAVAANNARCALHYTAIEIDPLDDAVFADLLAANFPEQKDLVSKTIAAVQAFRNPGRQATTQQQMPDLGNEARSERAQHGADGVPLTELISLRLIIGDALTVQIPGDRFDALYLDAFSPQHNPELWTADFLGKAKALLKTDATLVSYCVSRSFRDSLTDAGFDWIKVPGPPGKREVLIAKPL